MAKVIMFGTGNFGQLARFYFERDSAHEVVAYTVDAPEHDGSRACR